MPSLWCYVTHPKSHSSWGDARIWIRGHLTSGLCSWKMLGHALRVSQVAWLGWSSVEGRLPRGGGIQAEVWKTSWGSRVWGKEQDSLVYMSLPPPGLELRFTHFCITNIMCIHMYTTVHICVYAYEYIPSVMVVSTWHALKQCLTNTKTQLWLQ